MEIYICFVTLSTGGKHKLTSELYNFFLEANSDDIIEIKPGVAFKKSAVMEVEDISKWEDDKNYSYGQPPIDVKQLVAGNVYERSTKSAKELLLKGFKKVKPNGSEQDLKKFLKPTNYKPLYNHVYDDRGEIIKYAWEVEKELKDLLPV